MKKILNICVKAFTALLVAFAVFMMVFTIFTVTTVDKNDRNVFGYKFYIVQSNSMSLSDKNQHLDIHFDAGDIIVAKNPENPNALQPGQVISFMSTNEVSYGETVTHMIRSVKTSDSGRVLGYVTYGTNTDTTDEALVTPDYVLGVYAFRLPKVGTFFAFVKSVPGYIVCILIPFLLLIMYNGVNVIRLFRQHKREQMAVIQAEKDQLEAERAEAQRMMQELMALKAQLNQNAAPLASPVENPAVTGNTQPQEPTAKAETNNE